MNVHTFLTIMVMMDVKRHGHALSFKTFAFSCSDFFVVVHLVSCPSCIDHIDHIVVIVLIQSKCCDLPKSSFLTHLVS